ncbi:hypothetical protein CAPTEDRAFT_225754 [Capitella teleta]|uniref:Pyrrolo-quinoline quinone repeat domain-containing protein n=1 Tax=Capitella teleta TaxID=283909 RepID=R7V0B7_CAPTE|nr:hypothetical protein CAPTEDRAFT_225754 [Capitella teleta]|eukprot:ELU09106.1 hypothetical protein CAPTEDRAFT_225754 [Capitella teleta]
MKTKKKTPMHDSDTDSVSSSTHGPVIRNKSLPILKASGASPLGRRRSLRIAALNMEHDMQVDLSRQETVVMETPRVLERMEISNNFKHWRKQKTLQPHKTIKEVEESSDEEMEQGADLLRQQTTSTDLQAALLRTQLKSSIKRKQLKRKATALTGGPVAKKRGDALNRQTSIAAVCELYVPPEADWPLKINGQVVWHVPLPDIGCCALFIDIKRCVLSDSCGNITELDENVRVIRSFTAPFNAFNFASNKNQLLVASDKGRIFDINTSDPELFTSVKGFNEILDMCFHGDAVAISDDKGQVAMLDVDGKESWRKKSGGETGWMVEVDDTSVYLAHSKGVAKFEREKGEIVWEAKCESPVLSGFGVSEDASIGDHNHCDSFSACYDEETGRVVYEVKLQNQVENVKRGVDIKTTEILVCKESPKPSKKRKLSQL